MSVLPLKLARSTLDLGLKPSSTPSKNSGGTANALDEERKKCSFDVETMTNCLDGGKDQTARRRFFQRSARVRTRQSSQVVRILTCLL
jgi:hypothetical protein